MNSVRYVLAVVALIGTPPGLALWFVIHPFAGFWRRFGPVWTYAILMLPVIGMMVGTYAIRGRIVGADFGTNIPLMALGGVCVVAGGVISRKRRKYLTARILVGVPELSQAEGPGELLTEGIYGRIRHPRYVEALLFVLAYATITNFLGVYVLFVLSVPTMYFLVVLEERELRERFGHAHEVYCSKVPRFIPRPRARS